MALFNWFKKNKKENQNNEDLNKINLNDIDLKNDNLDFEEVLKDFEVEEKEDKKSFDEEKLEKEIEKIKEDLKNITVDEKIFFGSVNDEKNIFNDKESSLENDTKEIENSLEQIENDILIEEKEEKKETIFSKIKKGLEKTRKSILNGVDQVLANFTKIDEELFEELEETLIMSDIGVETSLMIMKKVREIVKLERLTNVSDIKNVIIRVISEIMESNFNEFNLKTPAVILIIGVNGVGKTTSIGKLANYFKEKNKKVVLAAADTFRAAAIEQLEIWGERNCVDVIKHQENSDPAAVIFDAIKASKARKADILICDTAGRLHNKKNLMQELNKISRIIEREFNEAQKEVFLVLDATTGQNALQQAKLFNEVADITGLILTKLDGTAKGGVIISIKNELDVPVRFIGIGEGKLDLRPFNTEEFVSAIFEE